MSEVPSTNSELTRAVDCRSARGVEHSRMSCCSRVAEDARCGCLTWIWNGMFRLLPFLPRQETKTRDLLFLSGVMFFTGAVVDDCGGVFLSRMAAHGCWRP
jgi:hypothetical protein